MSGPEFREAMSRLGAAVNVITSSGVSGRVGFTATAVCSVSDQPPTLLVCMNRSSSLHETLKANGVLCVNTLADAQRDLSPVFAGATGVRGEDRFKIANWSELTTGAPVLDDALVSFDCRIDRAIEVGPTASSSVRLWMSPRTSMGIRSFISAANIARPDSWKWQSRTRSENWSLL